jgi:hypothetical protein
MNPKLLQFSIVVLASDHNPTILNPDFLRLQEIVPDDWGWELASPPIMTPPFATVQYDSNVSISVESNKLQAADNNVEDPSASKLVSMVKRYVEVVPHVRYTAVGMNFRSGFRLDDADNYLKERFLKSGAWDSNDNPVSSIGLKFVYPVESGRLVLSIDSGFAEEMEDDQLQKKPVIITNANFHRDLDTNTPPTSNQVPNYLDLLSSDWNRLSELLANIMPTN